MVAASPVRPGKNGRLVAPSNGLVQRVPYGQQSFNGGPADRSAIPPQIHKIGFNRFDGDGEFRRPPGVKPGRWECEAHRDARQGTTFNRSETTGPDTAGSSLVRTR